MNMPPILHEDEELIAINKPHGLLVHRTNLATDATEFALQLVRNYVGKRVYPAHRLDRKTSGVLLFTKSKEANSKYQQLFRERKVVKTYMAIVRGYTDPEGQIDYPLEEENKIQESITNYKTLENFEIDVPSGKFPTSRYSLIEINPITGRYHQIRKHMAHIFHPVIGDRPHGCNKQNKLWKEKFGMTLMLLHAKSIKIHLPQVSDLSINAPESYEFGRALEILKKSP